MKLSKQDLKILELLQIDVKTSVERLSEEVGLSTASIQRHLKRLRDNKVIAQEVAIISPNAVNQSMTFIISVQLNRNYNDCFNYFKNKVKKNNNIQQCYYITGEADFVLIVTAKDMENFEEFTQSFFFSDIAVLHFKTSVVMGRTKVGLTLPLDCADS
ncbi:MULTISPECIES: Lrp/AsnC family transcriptional regulator [unclassified Pseudoalteromonas]|uniref:Lrp/AsnC family transcriptional regulator n=1 Tax=unclassified Pseudoalteromonas TaxID=194690 RepID=UPI0005A7370A|nr:MULTISPECIES: Lrp/AsnC family transcriptional regulator [unclassified Pseudoalteromonas]